MTRTPLAVAGGISLRLGKTLSMAKQPEGNTQTPHKPRCHLFKLETIAAGNTSAITFLSSYCYYYFQQTAQLGV